MGRAARARYRAPCRRPPRNERWDSSPGCCCSAPGCGWCAPPRAPRAPRGRGGARRAPPPDRGGGQRPLGRRGPCRRREAKGRRAGGPEEPAPVADHARIRLAGPTAPLPPVYYLRQPAGGAAPRCGQYARQQLASEDADGGSAAAADRRRCRAGGRTRAAAADRAGAGAPHRRRPRGQRPLRLPPGAHASARDRSGDGAATRAVRDVYSLPASFRRGRWGPRCVRWPRAALA